MRQLNILEFQNLITKTMEPPSKRRRLDQDPYSPLLQLVVIPEIFELILGFSFIPDICSLAASCSAVNTSLQPYMLWIMIVHVLICVSTTHRTSAKFFDDHIIRAPYIGYILPPKARVRGMRTTFYDSCNRSMDLNIQLLPSDVLIFWNGMIVTNVVSCWKEASSYDVLTISLIWSNNAPSKLDSVMLRLPRSVYDRALHRDFQIPTNNTCLHTWIKHNPGFKEDEKRFLRGLRDQLNKRLAKLDVRVDDICRRHTQAHNEISTVKEEARNQLNVVRAKVQSCNTSITEVIVPWFMRRHYRGLCTTSPQYPYLHSYPTVISDSEKLAAYNDLISAIQARVGNYMRALAETAGVTGTVPDHVLTEIEAVKERDVRNIVRHAVISALRIEL